MNTETMITNVLYYFLIGIFTSFILEKLIRESGEEVDWSERFWMITLWPIMDIIFIYHFIKAFFDGDSSN